LNSQVDTAIRLLILLSSAIVLVLFELI